MGAELGPVAIPLLSCLRSVFSGSNTSSVHQMQPTTTTNIQLQQPLLASDMEPFTYRPAYADERTYRASPYRAYSPPPQRSAHSRAQSPNPVMRSYSVERSYSRAPAHAYATIRRTPSWKKRREDALKRQRQARLATSDARMAPGESTMSLAASNQDSRNHKAPVNVRSLPVLNATSPRSPPSSYRWSWMM